MLTVSLAGCANQYHRVKNNKLYFYLQKQDARIVQFACSKDGYKLHPAQKVDSRTWRIMVPSDSEFAYFYIVDGKIFLPPCPLREKDDFGSENCIFVPDM
jgi:predicted cupin superfamily sugar epimerase